MTLAIQAIFCSPPIAVARLGGSTAPLAAYTWTRPPNPRADGETVIAPQWSLNILTDGSVDPFMPDSVRFRDGDLIRPVCPFIEMWARMGEAGSNPSTWSDVPLTPALLAKSGMDESALLFRIDARNAKAARRRNDANLAFARSGVLAQSVSRSGPSRGEREQRRFFAAPRHRQVGP
jgi:hypothetical protein